MTRNPTTWKPSHMVFWGSHGCHVRVEHIFPTECRCVCALEGVETEDTVGAWPHYGESLTRYWGQDTPKQWRTANWNE